MGTGNDETRRPLRLGQRCRRLRGRSIHSHFDWASHLKVSSFVLIFSILAFRSNVSADGITFEIITTPQPSASVTGNFPSVVAPSTGGSSSPTTSLTSDSLDSSKSLDHTSTEYYHHQGSSITNSSSTTEEEKENLMSSSNASSLSVKNIWQYQEDGHETDFRDIIKAVLPMTAAFFSVVGSYVMARESYVDARYKKTREATLPMQLVSMSIGYCIYSFGQMIGPLAGPSQVVDVWGTMGTVQTCTFQGFVIQFGYLAALMAHTTLVWYIFVMVKYNWKDDRMRRYFYFINGSIWLASFVFATIQIPLQNYNFNGWTCWLREFPKGCEMIDTTEGEDADETAATTQSCIRGKTAQLMRNVLGFGPGWCCALAVMVMFIVMWIEVRKLENQISRYKQCHGKSTTPNNARSRIKTIVLSPARLICNLRQETASTDIDRDISEKSKDVVTINRKKSKAVGIQGLLYTGEYIGLFAIHTTNSAIGIATGSTPFALDLTTEILLSAAAFLAFLIFIRLRREMNTPEGQIARKLVCWWNPLLACCGKFLQQQSARDHRRQHPGSTPSLPVNKTNNLPHQSTGWKQLAPLSDEVYRFHHSTNTRSTTMSSRFSSTIAYEESKQEETIPVEAHSEQEGIGNNEEFDPAELKHFDELDTLNDASLLEIYGSQANEDGKGGGNNNWGERATTITNPAAPNSVEINDGGSQVSSNGQWGHRGAPMICLRGQRTAASARLASEGNTTSTITTRNSIADLRSKALQQREKRIKLTPSNEQFVSPEEAATTTPAACGNKSEADDSLDPCQDIKSFQNAEESGALPCGFQGDKINVDDADIAAPTERHDLLEAPSDCSSSSTGIELEVFDEESQMDSRG